jgi:hypothetical protein
MEKFKGIQNLFLNKRQTKKDLEAKIALKEKQIERLKKRVENNYPYWTDNLIKPLMEEVEKRMPELTFEDKKYVPMGLCCRVSIFPMFKEKTLMLSFIPGNLENGELRIEPGERNDQVYSTGSIAELNGFGKVSVPVTSVKQIVSLLRKQMAEK